MPIVLGLLVGFFVWAHLFVFIAPLLAVLNFFTGRFFCGGSHDGYSLLVRDLGLG